MVCKLYFQTLSRVGLCYLHRMLEILALMLQNMWRMDSVVETKSFFMCGYFTQ